MASTAGASHISSRQELVLLLTSSAAESGHETYPLDRVRLQKAGFLLTMRGPTSWRDMFFYRPYDWGPYSDQLTADLRQLQELRLLRTRPSHGKYDTHQPTAAATDLVKQAWDCLEENERAFIRQVRAYVTSRAFAELLSEVYAAYPDYAAKSKFTG